jgi:O-antigen ligase
MLPPSVSIPAALAIFIVAVIVAFGRVGPRRAVIASLIGGTLFLPVFEFAYQVPVLSYKMTFVPGVVLAASLLLDGSRWRNLRLGLFDAPAAILCLVPFAASLSNGLGAYDGFHAALSETMLWGAPYLLGRAYLGEPGAPEQLAAALVKGALLYVPLCAWELRMSPQLHVQVYGFGAGNWVDHVRQAGYRPKVFMNHGLMLALFMATATLIALWMWRTGARRRLWGAPLGWCCAVLAVTTLLTKSVGAILLLVAGCAILELTRRLRTRVLLLVLLSLPAVYCSARIAGWSGQALVAIAEKKINPQRSQSLAYRIGNEDQLIAKALRRPWLGWGGWGRSAVLDEEGKSISVTDGLWIISLGTTGAVGLVALVLFLVLPQAVLLRRFPARHWANPRLAAPVALAVSCLLFAVDSLFNAMPTPLYPAACGGLATFTTASALERWRRLLALRARRDAVQVVSGPRPAAAQGPRGAFR